MWCESTREGCEKGSNSTLVFSVKRAPYRYLLGYKVSLFTELCLVSRSTKRSAADVRHAIILCYFKYRTSTLCLPYPLGALCGSVRHSYKTMSIYSTSQPTTSVLPRGERSALCNREELCGWWDRFVETSAVLWSNIWKPRDSGSPNMVILSPGSASICDGRKPQPLHFDTY